MSKCRNAQPSQLTIPPVSKHVLPPPACPPRAQCPAPGHAPDMAKIHHSPTYLYIVSPQDLYKPNRSKTLKPGGILFSQPFMTEIAKVMNNKVL